jgi:hypothetical protein
MQFKIIGVGLLIRFAPKTLAHMRDTRNVCRILVETPEEKKKLWRHRHKFGDNIKFNLKESWAGVAWWVEALRYKSEGCGFESRLGGFLQFT